MSPINSRAKGKRDSMRVTARVCYCACGCGRQIPDRDIRGVPQRYVHGHNATKGFDNLYAEKDCGYDTPCWVWQGGKNENGYGRMKYEGRMQPAHRVALLRVGVEVPAERQIDHKCRVPACVNPEHLEVVTGTENVRRSRAAKLTAEAVAEIRAVRDAALSVSPTTAVGTPRVRVPGGLAIRRQLAARYGVTADTIKHVWAGTTWR